MTEHADHRLTQGPARFSWAARTRCPLCGHKPVTHDFGEMVETCDGCGYIFDQGESGYYVGAMIMSTGVTIVTFLLIFGVSLLLTWPDVPWDLITYVSLAAMIIVPIWFYPRSKTIWIWLDLTFLNRSSG